MSEVGPGKPPIEHRFKPGQSGNPKGRPKGSKSLATIVRELENEDFDWSLVPIKQKELAAKIGSPWKAIVYTAIAKSFSGDTKAMEWLRKSGYGDKLDILSGGERIQSQPVIISQIGARHVKSDEETVDSNTTPE